LGKYSVNILTEKKKKNKTRRALPDGGDRRIFRIIGHRGLCWNTKLTAVLPQPTRVREREN
jgi:hypothetical protein